MEAAMKRLVIGLEVFIQCLIFYSLAMYFLELEFAGTENSREGVLFFLWSERVVAGIFTIEYFVRWFYSKNRKRYPFTPMAIVDLVAVLPFYIGFMVDLRILRLVRTLRILRLFKFYRYNEALRSFVISFNSIRRELQVIGVAIIFLVFLSATIEYEFERKAQPEMFEHYSDAVWWSVITLTTVGYGDMFPITVGGRVTAVLTLIMGLGIFGTFLSLVGSAFMETLQEKNRTICISETAQRTLIEICKMNGSPTDDDSLKDMVGDFIAYEYKKNVP